MEIVRGDTKDFYVLVKDEDGNIFNLTDYSMTFTARTSIASVDVAITSSAILVEAEGRGNFEIPVGDTDIIEGSYVYDIQIDSATKRYTVVRNQPLEILPGVTRP